MARILVVEDDDRLRELLVRQLARLGHEACAVAGMTEALGGGWTGELAIVHLGAPGGWGRLGVPVVATSGGPESVVPPEVVALLRKPYTLAELAGAIRMGSCCPWEPPRGPLP